MERAGYSGKWWIVCDDEDATLDEYHRKYPGRVVVFNKAAAREITDEMDNFGPGKVVVYARNACWGIAEQLGLTHFLVLDDDYTSFRVRFRDGEFGNWMPPLDDACDAMLDYLDAAPWASIAMSQGGDYFGGRANTKFPSRIAWRKAMNSFFCRTDRPFRFMGRINEDANAYTVLGLRGELFFTFIPLQLTQTQTQASSGGLTEAYLDIGTYVKSFYTVMLAPSCAKVAAMGLGNYRLHHLIKWRNAMPHIIREKHRKPRTET